MKESPQIVDELTALRRLVLEARGLIAEAVKLIQQGRAQQAETQLTHYLNRTKR